MSRSLLIPWLIVLAYTVPIIGTLATMRRRFWAAWSIGDSLRKLLPEDRVYRWVKNLEQRYLSWRARHQIGSIINLNRLNLFAGHVEYAFGHLRDYTLGVYMMAAFVANIVMMLLGSDAFRASHFTNLFYHGTFGLLSLWSYRRHVTTGLQMTEFMRINPHVHPEEFFQHYYRRLGPSATPIPTHASRIVDPTNVSYLTGQKPTLTIWPLLKGLYDTAIFARSAHKALVTIGREYGRDVFDAMASLWGSRMIQLFQGKLVVEGVEKFHNLSGKIILVFNHKSNLDFVFNFFALSSTHLANGRRIRPRYMAAKDHFVDNKFVYSGLGVGQLIEANDMVFVDRKGKGKNAVLDACQKLVGKDIEIAMYPQGTRAFGNFDRNGKRMDAGFYTTGTARALKEELGHLKKGCAFLAIDTAMTARDHDIPVHLVFIGIDGTANMQPKGSFLIGTEQEVRFSVGNVFTLTSQDIEGLEKPEGSQAENDAQSRYLTLVDRIQGEINRGLVTALKLHEKLKNRFLKEAKDLGLVPREQLLILTHRLTQGEKEDAAHPHPIFVILDRIFALPPRQKDERILFLKELAQRLIEGTELFSLKDKVTDELFHHRGKELKTIVEQEKAKKSA